MRLGDVSASSLFKLGLSSLGLFWVVASLFFGVLALLGFDTVYFNRQPVTGFPGLALSLVFVGIFSVLSAIAMTLGGLLARLIPRLRGIQLVQSDMVGLNSADRSLNNVD